MTWDTTLLHNDWRCPLNTNYGYRTSTTKMYLGDPYVRFDILLEVRGANSSNTDSGGSMALMKMVGLLEIL